MNYVWFIGLVVCITLLLDSLERWYIERRRWERRRSLRNQAWTECDALRM